MQQRLIQAFIFAALFVCIQPKSEANKRTFKPCSKDAPKDMVCIPGGQYIRGSNRNAQHKKWQMRAESPRHAVTLNTFYVDKYEVTNEQYIQCMKAGHCKPPAYWAIIGGSFWKRFRSPKRPFVRATWFLAHQYCKWAGKRLLTEAEWEAAARGPKGDTYPWGNQPPDCTKANYRAFPPHTSYPAYRKMRFCPNPKANTKKLFLHGQDQTWPVGISPPFRGIYDMAGNGYEWVQDFYDPHAYAGCDDPNDKNCPRVNPKGPCDGKPSKLCFEKKKVRWFWKKTRKRITLRKGKKRTVRYQTTYTRVRKVYKRPRRVRYKKRILKGGSWWWYADKMRAAYRRADGPYTGTHRLSIRCGSSTPIIKRLPPTGKSYKIPQRAPRKKKKRPKRRRR